MKTISTLLLATLACGCTATPHYDERFGEALRNAKLAMTIHPDAGHNADPAAGLDGKAAQEAIARYQATFKDPPPAVSVVNIGGPIGTADARK